MRLLKFVFYTVWLILLAILQPTVVQWIEIFEISPNLFLIFVVSTAFLRGKKAGAVCGLIFGLVLDFLVGRLIGVNAIIFMYIGLLAGVLCERFLSGTGSITASVVIFILSLMIGVVYYIAYSMLWGDISFFKALIRVIMPEALYSAVLGLILFVPIRKSFGLISRRGFARY